MKTSLVLACSDPRNDPRPYRMMRWLREISKVSVAGDILALFEEDDMFRIGIIKTSLPLMENAKILAYRLKNAIQNKDLIFLFVPSSMSETDRKTPIEVYPFDLIVSHDLVLLPLAFSIRKEYTKVILDAREFYPNNFDDQLIWRLTLKPLNQYLCRKYLGLCDSVLTVSEGIAEEYYVQFGVSPEVIMSLPEYHALQPTPVDRDHINLIHHGWASPSRKIDRMIQVMDYVDDRFTLDLMMIPGKGRVWREIQRMVKIRENVRIIPPVRMPDIVPFTNQYDIGLFLVPPTNFNLKYTLPNKLFEFIQARLGVAIGPSIEMRKIVEQYRCGIVTPDFSPRSMALELNKLDEAQILKFKTNSDIAAKKLNADVNREKLLTSVSELFGKTGMDISFPKP